MKLAKQIPSKTLEARHACLQNAEDMLKASKAVLKENIFNIAFHLAVVALEEIGKACMLVMSGMKKVENEEVGLKHIDDHTKKIFWALFDLTFSSKPLTGQEMKDNEHIAHVIHDLRLKSMYVDVDDDKISIPSTSITKAQAENIVGLAESRLEIEKARKFSELDDEAKELMDWFLQLIDDPEWSKYIFSRKSLEKLAEYHGQSKKWILWLKEIYDKQTHENRLLAEAEINKPEPSDDDKTKEKWKIKIRLYSQSFSIRQKILNKWNEVASWIKIKHGGDSKKNDFTVEFTLPNSISINSLYYAGWGIARKFVVAMNIGTMGFIWWYLPKYVDKFYCEKIYDIENKTQIDLKRNPELSIDWGQRALDEGDISRIAMSFACIPGQESPFIKVFDYYYGGLTFMGLNDINYQCEDTAFANFYLALKEAAAQYGKVDFVNFNSHLAEVFGQDFIENIQDVLKLGEEKISNTGKKENYTLEKVGTMKVVCDTYLLKQFKVQKLGGSESL